MICNEATKENVKNTIKTLKRFKICSIKKLRFKPVTYTW